MLTKNDLMLVLTDLESSGINITKQFSKLATTDGIAIDVLKFINDNRQFDVAKFYDMLRKNYNNKKSKLYMNLVREQFDNAADIVVTLSALNLQIMLFAKNLEDNKMFLKHSRAAEISDVLSNYYKTYDLIPCMKMLKLIKADLKCFEKIS